MNKILVTLRSGCCIALLEKNGVVFSKHHYMSLKDARTDVENLHEDLRDKLFILQLEEGMPFKFVDMKGNSYSCDAVESIIQV